MKYQLFFFKGFITIRISFFSCSGMIKNGSFVRSWSKLEKPYQNFFLTNIGENCQLLLEIFPTSQYCKSLKSFHLLNQRIVPHRVRTFSDNSDKLKFKNWKNQKFRKHSFIYFYIGKVVFCFQTAKSHRLRWNFGTPDFEADNSLRLG